MREVTFLRKNAEKWTTYEAKLKKRTRGTADDLAELYIELNNDLAYAQSCYPNTNTVQYLNDLSILAHNIIYKNKKESTSRLISFWTTEIPELFSYRLKELTAAVVIFLIFCGFGVVSQLNDPSFARLILSDEYVNLTKTNIEAGDPLGIYKSDSQMNMFFQITFNNVKVSFMCFIFGIFTAFGTGYILMKNGIMVGVFISFFQGYGLLSQSALVIFIHGALELSAITIAAAAGFVLGNSFVMPGTYKRKDAFIRGAKDGLKMVLSLVPVFIIAGFLESFVTRYTDMPLALSLSIIILSFTFIIGYYFILPIRINLKRRTMNG
tara:strand:+ start:7725 stop:8693 length:969 start_codon:yes stop_codon:yes gene_type:complete